MGDKLSFQSWDFDLFIVVRNFSPNVAMAILKFSVRGIEIIEIIMYRKHC